MCNLGTDASDRGDAPPSFPQRGFLSVEGRSCVRPRAASGLLLRLDRYATLSRFPQLHSRLLSTWLVSCSERHVASAKLQLSKGWAFGRPDWQTGRAMKEVLIPMQSPTVRRRRLAAELRRLREERGLTLEQVSDEVDWHPTKLSRIETAKRAVRTSDVRALLAVYELARSDAEPLLALAREARQRSWWQAYGDAVPESFQVYLGLESEATSLLIYESEFVPGLLQTEDYTRALHRAKQRRTEDEIEQMVAVRTARQALLTQAEAPQLWTVINEAVIRRVVGGPEIMSAQLARLVEATKLPNVTLQVLPFTAGAHAAMGGGFHALSFPPPAGAVVYIEYQTGSLYLEKSPEIDSYMVVFDHLRASALPAEASRSFIAQVAKEIK